jgi:hypothetical protein
MNRITIEHEDSAMVDRFEQAYNSGKACEEFLPTQEDTGDGWYYSNAKNWGTKWDIGSGNHGLDATRVGNQITACFDSAWSPPLGLYNKLVELGFDVQATYWEPGMSFCGIWDNGYDNYVEYDDPDMIPVELRNEYHMDEFFEESESL